MFKFSLRPCDTLITLSSSVLTPPTSCGTCSHIPPVMLPAVSVSHQYSSQYYALLFKIDITFSFSFPSPGVPGHWFRLHGKHQTESCPNKSLGLRNVTRPDRIQIRSVTTMSPGKMKIKKALIPPMTLMTLLMSGTNMAMSTVTAIHRTVSM